MASIGLPEASVGINSCTSTFPFVSSFTVTVGSGWTNAKDAFVYGGGLFLLSAASAIIVGYPLGVFFGI